MAVHKAHHAFGVIVKRIVLASGFAFVPGKRRMRGPFHYQQRPLWIANGPGVFACDVWHTRQVDPIETITAVVEPGALAERCQSFLIATIVRASEKLVVGR